MKIEVGRGEELRFHQKPKLQLFLENVFQRFVKINISNIVW